MKIYVRNPISDTGEADPVYGDCAMIIPNCNNIISVKIRDGVKNIWIKNNNIIRLRPIF